MPKRAPPTVAYLSIVHGAPAMQVMLTPWDHEPDVLGSSGNARYQLVLPGITKMHCSIRRHHGFDRLAANGSTWVDDKLVDGNEVKLADGNELRVGAVVMLYERVPDMYVRQKQRREPVDVLTHLPLVPPGRKANLKVVELPHEKHGVVVGELAIARLARRLLILASGEARVFAMPQLGYFHVDDPAVARRLAVEASLESIDVRRTNKDHTRIALELVAIEVEPDVRATRDEAE